MESMKTHLKTANLRKSTNADARDWNVQIVTLAGRGTRCFSYRVDERDLLTMAGNLRGEHSRVVAVHVRNADGDVWTFRK